MVKAGVIKIPQHGLRRSRLHGPLMMRAQPGLKRLRMALLANVIVHKRHLIGAGSQYLPGPGGARQRNCLRACMYPIVLSALHL